MRASWGIVTLAALACLPAAAPATDIAHDRATTPLTFTGVLNYPNGRPVLDSHGKPQSKKITLTRAQVVTPSGAITASPPPSSPKSRVCGTVVDSAKRRVLYRSRPVVRCTLLAVQPPPPVTYPITISGDGSGAGTPVYLDNPNNVDVRVSLWLDTENSGVCPPNHSRDRDDQNVPAGNRRFRIGLTNPDIGTGGTCPRRQVWTCVKSSNGTATSCKAD